MTNIESSFLSVFITATASVSIYRGDEDDVDDNDDHDNDDNDDGSAFFLGLFVCQIGI